jgi:hypothetical protein
MSIDSISESEKIRQHLRGLIEKASKQAAHSSSVAPVWVTFSKKGEEKKSDQIASAEDKVAIPLSAFEVGYSQRSGGTRARNESFSGGSPNVIYLVYVHPYNYNALGNELFGNNSPKVIPEICVSFFSVHEKERTEPIETWKFFKCLGIEMIVIYNDTASSSGAYLTGIAFIPQEKMHNDIKKRNIPDAGIDGLSEGTYSASYNSTYFASKSEEMKDI